MLRFSGLVIIICISLNATALGQIKSSWQEMFILKVAPLALIDPYTPGISLGLEFQPLNEASIQFEYNIPFAPLSFFNYNAGKIDHQTTRYRGEFRLYIDRPNEATATYLAAEGFYTAEKYLRENGTLLRDNVLYGFATSNINRTVVGGAIKAGYQRNINSFLIIDVYGGLGVRNVVLTHNASALYPSALLFDPRWGGDQKEGNFMRLHVALGFRIGISLQAPE